MKRVIRYGVFETNSSSSHSITVMEKDPKGLWRAEKDIPGDEKEIRSAVEKMLFVWGIITASKFEYLRHATRWAQATKNKVEREESLLSIEKEKQELIDMRETLIRECKKVQIINESEVRSLMIEGEERPFNHSLCCRYFNEDCLDDCTCCMNMDRLYAELNLDSNENSVEEFAQALFDENVYFLTEEGFYGGWWHIRRSIF